MKCKTILCTLITVYVASFSSLSAENKNRFSAGIGSSSGYAFLETLFFPSPGITIDSPNENIEGRIEDDTDFKSGLNLYNVSYDRMVFKHLALGFVYNYENINYIINYENYDTSETDLTIHCLMPRIKIIHGFQRVKMYHALAVGFAIFDETLTEKVHFSTESYSKTSYEPVWHCTLVGFEFHLTEDAYLYIENGYGYSGFFNIGAGLVF